MRISQVCLRFAAPGGVEQHVLALSREFVKLGHEVTVHTSDLYSEQPWETRQSYAEPEGMTVRRSRAFRDLMPRLRYLVVPGIIESLLSDPGEVIHAHSHRYFHFEAAATVSRVIGTPLILTPHFHPVLESEGAWDRTMLNLGHVRSAWKIYRHAARVLTVTDLEKRFLSSCVPAGNCVTVGNGIDPAEWEDARPEPFREKSGISGPYILYAGRLASNKGLLHLVEAFAGLGNREVKLVLVGKDWGMGQAVNERVRAAGLTDRVLLAGHLDDTLYRSAMKGCELLVLPSEWEAFGIVLLEAMLCEKPVVATAVGGVPEVVQEGVDGHLVPYGDPAALRDRMERLLSDPALRRRMGGKGRAKVRSRYVWSEIAQKVLSVYKGALEAA